MCSGCPQEDDRTEEAERRAKVFEDLAKVVKDPAEADEHRVRTAEYRAEADRRHWQRIILILQGERRRIKAWNQIQKKKKKKEGKYRTICFNSICSDLSFTILENVLMFLEAEVKGAWSRQMIVYLTNFVSDAVSVIAL
jgi:hypothetical protein